MSLRDYIEIVWRRKFVVAVIIGLGLLATSLVGESEESVQGSFTGDLTLAMNQGENFSDLLLFEQVAVRTNTIVNEVAATLGDDFFGPGIDTTLAIETYVGVQADPTVGTIRLTVVEAPSEEAAENLLVVYGDALIDYATGRRIASRDELLSSLERRETSILARIEALDAELDRLTGAQSTAERDQGVDPSRVTTAQLGSNLASLTQVQEEIAILKDQTEEEMIPIQRIGTPTITDQTIETSPLSLNQRLVVGFLLSALLGIGLALGLQRFDAKLYNRKETEAAFGLPVLAEIPKIRWWSRRRPALHLRNHPTSPVAGGFRLLRSGLAHARASQIERTGVSADGRGTIVLVTSVAAQTGKTTTVANLGAAAVDAGMSVLVVGADLRDPKLHEYFDVDPAVGITEAVRGRLRTGQSILDPFVVPTKAAGVSMLAQGEWVPNPGELLAQLQPILELATEQFDLVLVDTPPMLAGNDVSELVPFADLVLLAARSGQTTIDEAQWAEETASRLEAPLCGVVLIGSRPRLESRRGSLIGRVARRLVQLVQPFRRSSRSKQVRPSGSLAGADQDQFVQPGLFDTGSSRRPPSPVADRTATPQEAAKPPSAAAAPNGQTASPLTPPMPSNGHSAETASRPVVEPRVSAADPEPARAVDPDEVVATGKSASAKPDSEDAVPALGDWATMTVELNGIPLPSVAPPTEDDDDGDDSLDLDAGLVDEEEPVRNNTSRKDHPYPPPKSMSA